MAISKMSGVQLSSDPFFENLKGWMSPKEVSAHFGVSILTIYSWKAKSKRRNVPEGLFVKFNRKLYLRTSVLINWISSQNSS